MAANSTEFILNSLKGKIWLAVGGMAAINCVFGLLAYIAVSFLSSSNLMTIFIAFFLSSVTMGISGWWLSNEILQPIEKVTRLAQSLERSPATSLPKTTGSVETDDLLRTLHRNSQQLQNLIGLMDDVAAGKTDTASVPLQNSDRLSASFQKLVAKVTDSIDAKKDLIALQTSVTRLNADVMPIKGGNLDVNIHTEFVETRETAETVRYLLGRLNELARHVHSNTGKAKIAAIEVQRGFRLSVQDDESKRAKLSRAAATLSEMPGRLQRISGELSDSVRSASKYLNGFETGRQTIAECADFVDALRRQVNDAVRKIDKIRDRASSIQHISKTVEDLARRSKLLALNTSISGGIQASTGAALLSEEMASVSARADGANKEIAALNESLLRETAEIEAALRLISTDIPNISDGASAGESAAAGLKNCLAELAAILPQIDSLTAEQFGGYDNPQARASAADPFSGSLGLKLADSEKHLAQLLSVIENLQESIIDFRLPPVESYIPTRPAGSPLPNEIGDMTETSLSPDQRVLQQEG